MAVVINGSTGIDKVQDDTITSAKIVDGTIASGDIASGVTGKVLKVVHMNSGSRAITSSTSWVQTYVWAAITPSSASSKILVMVACSGNNNQTNGTGMVYTLYRNSTNIGHSTAGFGWVRGAGERVEAGVGITYLDSPNSTSEETYSLYFKSSTGSAVELPAQSGAITGITLMEIVG